MGGCLSMRMDVLYDETWEVPTDVATTKEFMCTIENMKEYIPTDSEDMYFKKEDDGSYYVYPKGELPDPGFYIYEIEKTETGISYRCDVPAINPMASFTLTNKMTET